jgi:hypothetical protein
MPIKKTDFLLGRGENALQLQPYLREGSQLGDPLTQGSLVFLLPIGARQPKGFEHLVADLLGDGPKRHYVADRGVYRGPESLGIGWRFGAKPPQPGEPEEPLVI